MMHIESKQSRFCLVVKASLWKRRTDVALRWSVWRPVGTQGRVCFPKWSSGYGPFRSQTVILGSTVHHSSFQNEVVFYCWMLLVRSCSACFFFFTKYLCAGLWFWGRYIWGGRETTSEDTQCNECWCFHSPPSTSSFHHFNKATRKKCYVKHVWFSLSSKFILDAPW